MRANLEKSVGMHRRVKGVFKSAPGEEVGTFDFRWRHNPHVLERKAICTVRRGEGWESLTISVGERQPSGSYWKRPPLWSEIQRLLPLFFEPHETPVQFWTMPDKGREGAVFYNCQRLRDILPHVPQPNSHFNLTKTPQ